MLRILKVFAVPKETKTQSFNIVLFDLLNEIQNKEIYHCFTCNFLFLSFLSLWAWVPKIKWQKTKKIRIFLSDLLTLESWKYSSCRYEKTCTPEYAIKKRWPTNTRAVALSQSQRNISKQWAPEKFHIEQNI